MTQFYVFNWEQRIADAVAALQKLVQGDKPISDGCADKLLSEVERIGRCFYSFMEVGVRRR
jgi:hypothetical protein